MSALARLGRSRPFLLASIVVPTVINIIILGLVGKSLSGMTVTAFNEQIYAGYTAPAGSQTSPAISWKPAFNLASTLLTLLLFLILAGCAWNSKKPAIIALPLYAQALWCIAEVAMWALSAATAWYNCKDLCGVKTVNGYDTSAFATYADLCCKCTPTKQITCPAGSSNGTGLYHATQAFDIIMLIVILIFCAGWFMLRSAVSKSGDLQTHGHAASKSNEGENIEMTHDVAGQREVPVNAAD